MSRISFDVTRIPNFGKSKQVLDIYMPQIARSVVRQVMVLGKTKSPVGETGFLQRSHITEYIGKSGTVYTGVVRPYAHYAGYVHHGTRYISPQPWLQDAVDEMEHSNPMSYIARDVSDLMKAIRAGMAARF